jgi:NDP-sugar pyrophosphorylase family protein
LGKEKAVKAVVMCGGLGTRLRPLTYAIPKPLLPVGEKPILELIVESLREHGIREIILSVGYRAELIETYFGSGRGFGVEISYVRERQPLGTAGALRLLEERLGNDFLMLNGDLLTRLDFRAMIDEHQAGGADLTIGTRPYSVQIPYGVIEHGNGRVTAINEKPQVNVLINAGIYVINRGVLSFIPREGPFFMDQLVRAAIAAEMTVRNYIINEYWLDMGAMEDYARANEEFHAQLSQVSAGSRNDPWTTVSE